jgi:hypothetical protein
MTKLVFIYLSIGIILIAFVTIAADKLDLLKESFAQASSPVIDDYNYINTFTSIPFSKDNQEYNNISNRDICEAKCSNESRCGSYVYDNVSRVCKLNYGDVEGMKINTNGSYSTSGGIKQRVTVTPEEKYKRFNGKGIENLEQNKIATFNSVNGVQQCALKCATAAKCNAFEYDFNDQTCTLSSYIDNLKDSPSKDAYSIVR